MSDPLRNLRALRAKVDHHAAEVMAAHPSRFSCRAGCDGCCQTERSVTDVEFEALRRAAEALTPGRRRQLRTQVDADHCTLLLEGRCALYDARPVICRSHGLPLLMDGQLDVCPLNFADGGLEELPPAQLLSVDTVTAILVVTNQLYCQEEGGDPERRRPVGALFTAEG